jgi:Flp pilus assembly protein TadD
VVLKRSPATLFLVVAAATVAAFLPVLGNGFLSYDDDRYITANPRVLSGFGPANALWAITSIEEDNWHPLTWWSHMLDVSLFGVRPGWHHLVSLLLHASAAGAMAVLVGWLTGGRWAPLAAALVFAVHPLRVESVAWAAERKDVLAALLFMLTLAAYRWHLERPSPGRYGLVCASYALGLAAKPMLVTLPAVLLLLDWWPLGRLAPFRRRCLEKLPLAALSAASAAVTLVAQSRGDAVTGADVIPLGLRAANTLHSIGAYLADTLLPTRLAVVHPFPLGGEPAAWTAAAAGVVFGCSWLAAATRRTRPWVAFGWLWFVGMLVPVLGLVQVGLQARADRYTYLPHVGLLLALAWSAAALLGRRAAQPAAVAALLAVVLCLAGLTWRQAGFWRDDITLFTRATRVTRDNWLAHRLLGNFLAARGRSEEAWEHWEAALRLNPRAVPPDGRGVAAAPVGRDRMVGEAVRMAREGRMMEAVGSLAGLLRREPDAVEAHVALAMILGDAGKLAEAIFHCREAIRIDPGQKVAWNNLGVYLNATGDRRGAVEAWQRALAIDPGYPSARANLEDARRAP